jgi:ribonuclease H2 subunit A
VDAPQCFVDTVGPAADYQAKLSSFFPTINFTVTSKADALFPIVSAASIVAKVTRDRILEEWCFAEPGVGVKGEADAEGDGDAVRVFGSGYPSGACLFYSLRLTLISPALTWPCLLATDPKTVAWLQDNFNPIFGFPNVARFSWAPVKNALLKKGVASKWCVRPRSNCCGCEILTLVWQCVDAHRDDEPASIQKYFTGKPAGPEQAPLWKDFNLVSVGEF